MTPALDQLMLASPSPPVGDRSGRVREAAAAEVRRLGLPTRKDEDWKYTPLRALESTAFERSSPGRRPARELLEIPYPGSRQVFVDGRFTPELSDPCPAGVEVLPLADAPFIAERNLGELAKWNGHAFTALNTALFEDGAVLRIADGARPEQPIHLWFVTTGSTAPTAVHPRIAIFAGARSELTLVETFLGAESAPTLINAVLEVWLGESASVRRAKLQRDTQGAFHIARTEVRLAKDARLSSDVVMLGGAMAHDELGVTFAGSGGSCELRGLFVATGKQHLDLLTRVDHAVERCASRELYQGVAGDSARGVFSGQVHVREGAFGTDAHQSSRNLLLSERASIDARPQLAIYTDDVRCTHGATVGYLDAEALFYLRSRGLPSRVAEAMLIEAFATEVLRGLPAGVNELLAPWLKAKLPSVDEVKA